MALWLPEVEDAGRRNWMKAVKRYKLPVITEVSTRDVMCNMINITLLYVTNESC